MRLLHSNTLEMKEFIDTTKIPYAILSHTWGDGEVSYQEMQCGEAVKKPGYDKIKRCCEVAAADGFEYIWIDTCCIDKTSSTELSEAINSMFQWYKAADTCYVYLADVDVELPNVSSQFSKSRWFTRGWTLQELIAPSNVIFFDAGWHDLGTRHSRLAHISKTTGIHVDALSEANLEDFSVAQRMSWASNRKTTRPEDIAYCLMGIFGISMPMLYGEGERAFLRLQEEIMKKSDDHSIFAWKSSLHVPNQQEGFLARSPVVFADGATIIRSTHTDSPPFAITNKGINLQLPLQPLQVSDISRARHFLAVLDCQEIGQPGDLLCIRLRKTSQGRFKREHKYKYTNIKEELSTVKREHREKLARVSIYATEGEEDYVNYDFRYQTFLVDKRGIEGKGISLFDACPGTWNKTTDGKIQSLEPFGNDRICVLGFACDEDPGGKFFVALLPKDNTVAAIVDTLPPEETILYVLYSYESEISRRQSSFVTDRKYWRYPGKSWGVSVLVKRRIVSGTRRMVVCIDIFGSRPISKLADAVGGTKAL